VRYPKLRENVTIGGVTVDLRMAVVLWTVTLVVMIYRYHSTFLATWLRSFGLQNYGMGAMGMAHHQFLLFFVVPIAVILLMGDSPFDYGLRLGRWKEGLLWLAAVCPLILVGLLLTVPGGDLEAMYRRSFYDRPSADIGPIMMQLRMLYSTGVLLWAWEYLLRGFCLFGLARVLGAGPAIFIQMVPFALLHLGKPELEAMTTWLSGIGFGFVAWRTQSFFYAFLIHWFLLTATILVAIL